MLSISDEVLTRWRALARDGQSNIDLQIRASGAPAGEISDLVRGVVASLVAETDAIIDATHPEPGEEPPWPGEWRPIELVDGSVAVRVLDCDALDVYLPRVAELLGAAGLEGEIALCEWPEAPALPTVTRVLECRMLVAGERWQRSEVTWVWRVGENARDRLADRAARWLTADGQLSAPMLTRAALPSVPLASDVDLVARFRAEIRDHGLFDVLVQTSGGFRIASWTRNHHQLALIDVGATDWHDPQNILRQFLRENADDVAYAYVRHGESPTKARHNYALKSEWPPRHGEEQAVLNSSATSWWDEYLPDAFALQLLGPSFHGRIPPAPSYDQEAVGNAVLLEHRDPAAWYEQRFVPLDYYGGLGQDAAVPPILQAARDELEPLLFRRALLWPEYR